MATIDISRATFPRLTNRNKEMLQAVRLVLGTRPGTFKDAPEYGFDPDEVLVDAMTEADAERLPLGLEAALKTDDRIERVELDGRVTRELLPGAGVTISVPLLVYPKGSRDPAPLTITINEVSLKVLERGGGA
jgi:hypothetical protein